MSKAMGVRTYLINRETGGCAYTNNLEYANALVQVAGYQVVNLETYNWARRKLAEEQESIQERGAL